MRRVRRAFTTVVFLGAIGLARAWADAPPHRPVPVDRAARCAQCEMRLSTPRHVAQLQTKEGEVLGFDDPGCLFRYLQSRRPRVHARYFRGPDGQWIRGRDVAFLPGARTPMGYGLAAVRRGTPGSISWEEAWRRVQERHAR
jgi:hypothetical protein